MILIKALVGVILLLFFLIVVFALSLLVAYFTARNEKENRKEN